MSKIWNTCMLTLTFLSLGTASARKKEGVLLPAACNIFDVQQGDPETATVFLLAESLI